MYCDVCSPNSYIMINRKLAKITNIDCAVYWAELSNLSEDAFRNKTYNAEGFFNIDRLYIEERTTISQKEQIELDIYLQNIGVLYIKDNLIKINAKQMLEILISEELDKIKNISKIKPKQKKELKDIAIRNNMKNHIICDDEKLKEKYDKWVDSVYDRGQFLNFSIIDIFKSNIEKYNKEQQNQLLDEAIITGYKDIKYLLSKLNIKEKKYIQKVSDGNFLTEVF